jgi:hypothetical protein
MGALQLRAYFQADSISSNGFEYRSDTAVLSTALASASATPLKSSLRRGPYRSSVIAAQPDRKLAGSGDRTTGIAMRLQAESAAPNILFSALNAGRVLH